MPVIGNAVEIIMSHRKDKKIGIDLVKTFTGATSIKFELTDISKRIKDGGVFLGKKSDGTYFLDTVHGVGKNLIKIRANLKYVHVPMTEEEIASIVEVSMRKIHEMRG